MLVGLVRIEYSTEYLVRTWSRATEPSDAFVSGMAYVLLRHASGGVQAHTLAAKSSGSDGVFLCFFLLVEKCSPGLTIAMSGEICQARMLNEHGESWYEYAGRTRAMGFLVAPSKNDAYATSTKCACHENVNRCPYSQQSKHIPKVYSHQIGQQYVRVNLPQYFRSFQPYYLFFNRWKLFWQ